MERPVPGVDEKMTRVFDAPDHVTAELVCATLRAAGVSAVLQHEHASPAAGWLNHLGLRYAPGVLVPLAQADAAAEILAAQAPTEEELAAEAQMTSLEKAEARLEDADRPM